MCSTIRISCLLSFVASVTDWPTIGNSFGSTAACAFVTLHKSVGAFHHARLRIGEVVLILVVRLSSFSLLGALALFCGFVPRPLLKDFLGLFDLGQPALAAPQFFQPRPASAG
jgi:hypothetical protein